MCVPRISRMPASNTEAPRGPALVYQGSDWLVVDKPAGMPVQPDPSGSADLLTWVRATTGDNRLELVNRLDRPVSGAVVLAAGDALVALNRSFRERQVRKVYHAIVEGGPKTDDPVDLTHLLVHDTRGSPCLKMCRTGVLIITCWFLWFALICDVQLFVSVC